MEPVVNGEIYHWKIRYANANTPFKGLLFVLAGCAAGYAIWWFYKREPEYCTLRRRKIMAVLRLIGVAILLFIISNPVLDINLRNYVKGKVVVLVDNSKSMSRVDTYARPEDRLVPAHVLGSVALSNNDPRSVSAAIDKDLANTTRWDIVNGLFSNKEIGMLEKLRSQYDVELWNFARADEMQSLTGDGKKLDEHALDGVKPDGVVTEIGGALRKTIDRVKGQPLSGIVLITDGGNNKGEEPTVVAQDSPARIFPVGIGVPEAQDVALTHMMMESKIFVDDPVRIDVVVKQHGFNGEQASLIVTSDNGEPIADPQPITLKDAGEQTEVLHVKAKKPGRFKYTVEVKLANPDLHDSEPSNNFKTRDVEVIDQKFNVLMLETDPRWEFRYLKNSLLRDKRVNCKILLRVPDMAELAKTSTTFLKDFPTREELFKFHVIVFGNMPNDGFFTEKDLDNIRRFVVEEGGGIWFIAGKNNFPDAYKDSKLESLIPVEFERNPEVTAEEEERSPLVDPFRAVITPDGKMSSITRLESTANPGSEEQGGGLWELLPPAYWCHKSTRAKLGATTLLAFAGEHGAVAAKRGEAMPLLVTQRVGRGKVLYQAFADLWRMRFPIELGPDALERFHGHVVQDLGLAKLLGRTARVEISTDREEYAVGDTVKIDARVLTKKDLDYSTADHVTAVVTDLNNETNTFKVSLVPVPGQKGCFRGPAPPCKVDGKFRVTLEDEQDEKDEKQAHADFNVTIPQIEMDSPDMKKDALDNIARSSVRGDSSANAHMYFADQVNDMLKDIKQAQRPLEESHTKSLWDSPLLLILFTLMMGGEWLMRKRSDLL